MVVAVVVVVVVLVVVLLLVVVAAVTAAVAAAGCDEGCLLTMKVGRALGVSVVAFLGWPCVLSRGVSETRVDSQMLTLQCSVVYWSCRSPVPLCGTTCTVCRVICGI